MYQHLLHDLTSRTSGSGLGYTTHGDIGCTYHTEVDFPYMSFDFDCLTHTDRGPVVIKLSLLRRGLVRTSTLVLIPVPFVLIVSRGFRNSCIALWLLALVYKLIGKFVCKPGNLRNSKQISRSYHVWICGTNPLRYNSIRL
ncbi:hypothetical protein Hanom_Chr00s000007g01614821 [Helianthus anomalus]